MSGSTTTRLPAAIGRYRILKELGRGMMGVVYLAQDPALERLIALKTIDLAFSVPEAERASFEQRFLAEARVAAGLQHPGIVVVHDVGRDDGLGILYIALEYLQGRTLSELTASGPLPWQEALRIVAGVARALHHAHVRGIVHRDVKPANVMLVDAGQPKIMDFGIAKVPSMELTSSGQFFGTPLYMSPEQANGDPLDGRSDLFSLGAVAYQLLTGRHAFGADSVVRVLARVATDEPQPPSRIVPGLPSAVDALVARAMRKDPARRYASGEEMADAADAVLAGRPAPAALEGTHELDAELLLEEVLGTRPSARPAAPPPADAAALGSVVDPAALESLGDLIPKPRPPRRRAWYTRPWAWMAAVVLLLATGAFLLGRRAGDSRSPAPRDEKGASTARVEPRREAPPTTAAEEVDADGPGRLEVNFEHHLRSGRIQIWIDDDDVLDQPFDSRVTQQILSLRLRKGAFEQVLPVSPGRHQVRVRLTWSGRWREQRISGTFAAGKTRTLEVRVSRVFNELSLNWR